MSFRADFRAKGIVAGVFLLLALLLAGTPLAAQSKPASASNSNQPDLASDQDVRGKKLVFKDGTFQLISKYQVIGDRVRYYSVERSDWEEIPASLVDWAATKKANAEPSEEAKRAIAIAHNLDLEKHPGMLDVGEGPGLPAGVLIPPGNGMFAFNGKKVLPLKTDLAKSSLDKGRFLASVIVPVPVISKKYTIFLEGKHAATRIANSEPVFFYRTSSGIPPRFQLVHAKVKGKKRELAFLEKYFGQQTTQANEIPLNLQKVENDTYRLMATQDLSPGEYALVQANSDRTINLYVWDFAIQRSSAKHPAKKKKK